eukprot:4740421-Pleurochrysis_carterae.AAC.1
MHTGGLPMQPVPGFPRAEAIPARRVRGIQAGCGDSAGVAAGGGGDGATADGGAGTAGRVVGAAGSRVRLAVRERG